jgi:hypothetical protein
MIHCAKLNDENVVTKIIVVPETKGIEWCINTFKGNWAQSFIDPETNHISARIGSIYNPTTQTFTCPQEHSDNTTQEGHIDGQENI